MLLDRFNYYNERLTERLLVASYNSLADGIPKGPAAPERNILLAALADAAFTPVEGERPNRTDSGNLMCRIARQVLKIPENRIFDPLDALDHARTGNPVVFLDDFIGSGDQFITTWQALRRQQQPRSFEEAYKVRPFTAIFISLVATDYGLQCIRRHAPTVAVSSAHIVDESSTVREMKAAPTNPDPELALKIQEFLQKYALRTGSR